MHKNKKPKDIAVVACCIISIVVCMMLLVLVFWLAPDEWSLEFCYLIIVLLSLIVNWAVCSFVNRLIKNNYDASNQRDEFRQLFKNERSKNDIIIDHLQTIESKLESSKKPLEQPSEELIARQGIVKASVTALLNNIYINPANATKDYLIDAICFAASVSAHERIVMERHVMPKLSKKYGKKVGALERAISRLLEDAWLKTDPDILRQIYSPPTDIDKGHPSNREFIVHIARNLKLEDTGS